MDKSFVTIGVNNLQESITFYQEVLGYRVEKELQPTRHINLCWIAKTDSLTIELVQQENMPQADNTHSSITLTYQVADLAPYKQILVKMQTQYTEMTLGPGATAIRFSDPNGVALSLVCHKN